VFLWLTKLFSKKAKPLGMAKPHRGQVQTGKERLIPLANLDRRSNQQALLQIEGLDAQMRQTILNVEMVSRENRPAKSWSDPA
jgi:hypothetical protein